MVLVHQEPPRRWEADDIIVTDPPVIRRAIGAAAIGNTTEWYDFGVYAFFEPTIQKVFFSDLDHTTGLIATFALFAVAFVVRPFGGLLFGPLADRIGRNKVLATTMILMALGTFAIGCIPSPQSIGLWAPVLLLCARLVQGFSTGGEYGNAMTFIAEYAPDRHRGFLGSCLEFGTYVGYLMGAAAVTLTGFLFTDEQMLDWGWRVPFFVALPLGLVGVYMRAKLADTPAFEQMEAESEAREKELRTRHTARDLLALWPFVLVCMGLVITWNVTAYMLTSYVPTYVSSTLPHATGGGISPRTSELLQIAIMAIAMVTIPLVGRYSDRIGRKPLLVAGSIIISVGAFPMFLLMQADSVGSVFAGLLLMTAGAVCFSAAMPSTLPSLFPTHLRGAGLSISFNIAVSLFGGTTSLISGSLVAATGNLNAPAFYMIFAGVIGLISVWLLSEPNGRRMWGSAPAAVDHEEAREIVDRQHEPEFAARL